MPTSDNLGTTEEGELQLRRNSLLSICGNKIKNIVRKGEIIPPPNQTEWYWPGEVVVNEAQQKLYMFANRTTKPTCVRADGSGMGGSFTSVGVDLAVFSLPKSLDEDPQFLYVAKTPASDSPEVDPDCVRRKTQWGASVVQGEDGYMYIYGSLVETRLYNFGRDAYVARVPLEQLEDPTAWQYFSGKTWTNKESAAVPVINTLKQPGLDVTWTTSYENGLYRMVSKRDGVLGTEIGEWTAKSPVGPFKYRKLVAVAPHKKEAISYNAHHHPGITLRNGEMLVSLCKNSDRGTGLKAIKHMDENPEEYSPGWYSFTTDSPE